ncbi:family 78 glycoside hydrolase catalytic domain [Sphingobacterium puteale]|uniref:family 78 glycoside hydrolase catalytic domain n=1 Tax=Sphingobacterium puteale TaxID=2420510 RepID=UPI003D95E3CA
MTNSFALLSLCLLSVLTSIGYSKSKNIKLYDLRCENLINPNALDNTSPHFSWKIKSPRREMRQQFYEIQVASDSITLLENRQADFWQSNKIASDASVMVPYAGKPLASRSLCYWRVRIWSNQGEQSDWSDIQRFGIGLLKDQPMQGEYIGLKGVHSPLLRKNFHLDAVALFFLHINSLGYYEVYINGKKVGSDVLSPAVSHLNNRSLINTYDVSGYLRKGENSIVLWLGTGWYKKTTGFNVAFDGALVRAQLDIRNTGHWQTKLVSDSSWEGSVTGYADTGPWQALQFGGERVQASRNPTDMDAIALNHRSWSPVSTIALPDIQASPQMTEPNRIQATYRPISIKQLRDSTWLIDMGKTLNGWFELDMKDLKSDQIVVFDYSDALDSAGNFMQQGQRDSYMALGLHRETFRNKFNHHAFQYIKISNLGHRPKKKDVKAHLIHTNFRQTSTFLCSDPDLNAIHTMVQYTMRCLSFSGYMVDCPHLERAGYGGDGNSSTNTLQTMFASSPLFVNWLQAWSDSMREGGSLPHVAPNPGAGGGGPYWCSFFIMASWRTYVNYQDPRLIQRHYSAMKQWLSYVERYSRDGLLTRWPDTKYRDWFLGDWLAPAGVDAGAARSVDLISNCVVSECLATMEKIATVLRLPQEAQDFAKRKEKLDALIHQVFFNKETNQYATGSQLDMSYPMLLGITPKASYAKVKQQLLKESTEKYNNHIAVGLVGVPILTQWATDNNTVDFMYTMLKQRDYPGYLFMLDHGASTTWEYWSGERSRIHNCYNGIGTWFYQAIGGIRVDENQPGYKHILITPQIPKGLTWAKTAIETPYGEVKVDWSIKKHKLKLDITLPVGSTATVKAPAGFEMKDVTINYHH